MIYLLSAEGRRALRSVASQRVLYAFDFDGTLAPLSPNRHGVKIPRSVSEWLKELAKRAPCAIVSGRSVADLTPRVAGTVPYLIGNHGIEGPAADAQLARTAERICAEWKGHMTTQLAEAFRTLSIDVEDKRYSLTLHFRDAAEPAKVQLAILGLVQQLTPAPRIITGKWSVNLLPPGHATKGSATLALTKQLKRDGLFFVGDDETDESVFSLKTGIIMGVRVGRAAESHAKFYVKHQSEVEEVLRFLVHRMDRTPEAAEEDDRKPNAPREAANDL
ncbi:putative Trehalose-phosphatase [Nitrospira sp. KM1]|uniref:trehalose-phosphatase n=1 Tax=Nitrospira sp. KM1 TaxID=1936990 RepID=UPI0013A74A7E|nr:trehalose-phosphatase [Nitrospira sp. KM1]BCA55300.1 putative Trehalose-phosphatase [Nitrospira sp. KM1]